MEFILKTRTKIGEKEALNLGKYLKELSFKRAGIIIDSAIFRLPYVKLIINNIKKEKFTRIKVWKYGLGAEPDYDSLDRIKLLFLNKKRKPLVDCFVGIGGGSVIDFAKGLATLTVNPGKAIKYRGFPVHIKPSLSVIALPTTAGTGSEVTFNAPFISWKEKKKMGINTYYNFPVLAILDPILPSSCPRKVAVSSGIDALVHAIDSYTSRQSNNLSRIFSKEAFRLIFSNLPLVLQDCKNLKRWQELQMGAFLAGVAIVNSGGGPTSSLSYPLGVNFKVPHGLAGGVFLPHIIQFNIKKGYDYSELYNLIEKRKKVAGRKETNELFSKEMFGLCKRAGIPSDLKTLGVNKENVKILLKETEGLVKAFLQNPVPFSVKEGKELILKLIK